MGVGGGEGEVYEQKGRDRNRSRHMNTGMD